MFIWGYTYFIFCRKILFIYSFLIYVDLIKMEKEIKILIENLLSKNKYLFSNDS